MRALSIRQPWVNAILYWGKYFENRTWKPPSTVMGKRIALHASKKFDQSGFNVIKRICSDTGLDPRSVDYVRGAILGSARVVGFSTRDSVSKNSPWFTGPYGWLLVDVHVLKTPLPCKGRLGVWRVPEEILNDILFELNVAGIPVT